MEPEERRARALASPRRWRILRICLYTPRTNKEIADTLGIDPATCLHHVRTLVNAGYLKPEEPRRGPHGANEIPYLATRATWADPALQGKLNPVLLATAAEEMELAPNHVSVTRLGFKITAEQREEWMQRFQALIEELAQSPSDPDGEAWSLMFLSHPDPQAD